MISFKTIFTSTSIWMITRWCGTEFGDFLIMLATAHDKKLSYTIKIIIKNSENSF